MINTEINFKNQTNGTIPVILQDAITNTVVAFLYWNEEAYNRSVEEKIIFSVETASQKVSEYKQENGHNFKIIKIEKEKSGNSILVQVIDNDGITRISSSDFSGENKSNAFFFEFLENLINSRKSNPVAGSYTNKLFDKGINKVAQKVGEEAVELVIEAKDNNKELFLGEAADLMFHYLVLLAAKNFKLSEVVEVLEKRHK